MPAPSAPTSFAVASRANPGLATGPAYPALKLGWTWNGGDAPQLEMRRAGVGDFVPFADAPAAGLLNTGRIDGTVAAYVYGLPWATSFDFRVRAVNSSGVSAWATLSTVATGSAAVLANLVAPTTFAVASNTSRGVVFTWDDNQDKESGYLIEILDTAARRRFAFATAFVFTATVVPDRTALPTFSASYTAKVRAVLHTTSGEVYGPWSNEVFFATAAEALAITNLPSTVQAWRGVAFGLTIFTNIPASSWAAVTGLPTGLTAATGVISGTPTDAVGTYTPSIAATNGNTDTQTLTILLREPSLSLLFAADGSNQYFPADDALARGVTTGAILSALTIRVGASAIGPIPTVLTVTLTGAPAWLSVSGQNLTGTPPGAGTWDFTVTGTNSTSHAASAVLRIVVPGVTISSAATANVFAGQPFEFTLAALPAIAVFTGDLPAWASLTDPALGVQKLRGTAPAVADTSFNLYATLAGETATQLFTVHAVTLFASETSWDLFLNQPVSRTARYLGAGVVESWFLTDAPPGLVIGSVGSPSGLNHRAFISGAPTATGVYDLIVTVQVHIGTEMFLFNAAVTAIVTGGLFLGWYHSDPTRREIQLLMRSEQASSYYLRDGALRLVRGDHAKLHVIPRDAPILDDVLGRRLILDAFTELRFTVKPKDDLDAEPWLEIGGAIVTETIGGNVIFVLEFDVTSDPLEALFTAANRPRGAATASVQMEGIGEVSIIRSGVPITFRGLPVSIIQDYDR